MRRETAPWGIVGGHLALASNACLALQTFNSFTLSLISATKSSYPRRVKGWISSYTNSDARPGRRYAALLAKREPPVVEESIFAIAIVAMFGPELIAPGPAFRGVAQLGLAFRGVPRLECC
jgi:hypothetical protein